MLFNFNKTNLVGLPYIVFGVLSQTLGISPQNIESKALIFFNKSLIYICQIYQEGYSAE